MFGAIRARLRRTGGLTARAAVAALPVAAVLAGCAAEDALSRAAPGDCVAAEEQGGKLGSPQEARIVSCTAPDAAYKVAMRLDGNEHCGDNTYGYVRNSPSRGDGWRLCLMLNAKVGDCFHQEIGFPTGTVTKVACGPSASYRVVAVVPGRADKDACAQGAARPADPTQPVAFAYPEPPHTVCVER